MSLDTKTCVKITDRKKLLKFLQGKGETMFTSFVLWRTQVFSSSGSW